MTVLALILLLLSAAMPLLDRPLRRLVADPVLAVGLMAAALLAAAAAVAAGTDPATAGWARAAAAVLGVLAAVSPGSHAVRSVFRLTRGEIRPVPAGSLRREPADDGEELELEAPGSVLRGGAWICYLERGAAAATMLAGFPEGLALVLAVKGVGRYPELRDSGGSNRPGRDAPEEFIIGTLASLLWAAACAGTAVLIR
jgi:hypothetical protein